MNQPYSICLVTDELMEIFPSGGIGTATHHMAKNLMKNGFIVEILLTNSSIPLAKKQEYKEHFFINHKLNINFIDLNNYQRFFPEPLRRSKAVYDFFKNADKSFDIILFHDIWHDGFFSVKCKGFSHFFNNTSLGVICHGPFPWVFETHGYEIEYWAAIKSNFEKATIEMADFYISPSHYLHDWMSQKGWIIPKKSFIIPYMIEPVNGWDRLQPEITISPSNFNEIVFFGRLESRKGVQIFIDALLLIPQHYVSDKIITFLGYDPSNNYYQKNVEKLNLQVNEIKWITDKNSLEARDYLQNKDKLIILPSLADNSPCVIYECLIDRLPFLTSNSGGQPELIDPRDHNNTLFDPNPVSLANKIISTLQSSTYVIPRPSREVITSVKESSVIFTEIAKKSRQNKTISNFISIQQSVAIIIISSGSFFINEVIQSAIRQTYQNVDIIIIEEEEIHNQHSIDANSHLQEKSLKIFKNNNKSIGEFLNNLIISLPNEFITIFDDSILLQPNFLSTCLNVLEMDQTEGVIPAVEYYTSGKKEKNNWLPAGGGCPDIFMPISLVENFLGKDCIFLKKKIVNDNPFPHINFDELFFWSYLLDLHLKKIKLSIYPDALLTNRNANEKTGINSFEEYHKISQVLEKNFLFDASRLGELFIFSQKSEQKLGLNNMSVNQEMYDELVKIFKKPIMKKIFCSTRSIVNQLFFLCCTGKK